MACVGRILCHDKPVLFGRSEADIGAHTDILYEDTVATFTLGKFPNEVGILSLERSICSLALMISAVRSFQAHRNIAGFTCLRLIWQVGNNAIVAVLRYHIRNLAVQNSLIQRVDISPQSLNLLQSNGIRILGIPAIHCIEESHTFLDERFELFPAIKIGMLTKLSTHIQHLTSLII